MEALKVDIRKLSEYLSSNGIKPSFQRLKILERLYNKKDHPTVNQIYIDLIDEIPSLSKTTVYNTMNLFIKSGIVKSIDVNSFEARYDLVSNNHGHFACVKCRKVFDIDVSDLDFKKLEDNGSKVITSNITVKGICAECVKNTQE